MGLIVLNRLDAKLGKPMFTSNYREVGDQHSQVHFS